MKKLIIFNIAVGVVAIVLAAIALTAVLRVDSVFGARDVTSYNRTAPSGGGEWTTADNVLTGNFWATASSTHQATTTFTSGIVNAGLSQIVVPGSCTDASSTILAVQNPFAGATSTGVSIQYSGYSGTSSLQVMFATSSNQYVGLSEFGRTNVWATTTIATSTSYFRVGPGTGFDTGGVPNAPGLTGDYAATSSKRFILGPSEWLVGTATGTNANGGTAGGNGGLVNASNTFTCTYKVKFEL